MAESKTLDHDHDVHHEHSASFWQKYIFTSDHKMIGIQYGVAAILFLLVGFFLMMVMRWSIAYPDRELPALLKLFIGDRWLNPDGTVRADLYNMFGAMHGTIMVFLGVVPIAFGAFGNYVTPLQIGAPDMAFPRLNMASFWCYFVGGVMMFGSFFLDSGPAQSGWTNYSPLATMAQSDFKNIFWTGQTQWLLAMVFIITSSLLGAVNFITTIINLRAKGMTWMRMPFFCWAQLVTGFLLLLAFPPLEVAALMQLMDRVAESSFFIPTGTFMAGQWMDVSGGGSPLLFQHLFWFLGHPEVYVLILPAIGVLAEIIPANTRKPLWGYKSMVFAVLVLGFLSFIVWAHHMYLTGMGWYISTFFQTTTVMISVPSVILLSCLMISLWGGSIRFSLPMLWAIAFLPMFGFGGLTGLPLAFNQLVLHLHDTYYVIGHFHYVVAPGSIFAFIGGVYHWLPNYTGKKMNDFLGHLHFWPSLLFMNVVFLPMFFQGMAGFHRRWHNGGKFFEGTVNKEFIAEGTLLSNLFNGGETITLLDLNALMTWGTFGLAVAQIPFFINLFLTFSKGKKLNDDNPWKATTLEWSTPTPPPHGNFVGDIEACRGPYEYSVPGDRDDFTPQWLPDTEIARVHATETPKEADSATV